MLLLISAVAAAVAAAVSATHSVATSDPLGGRRGWGAHVMHDRSCMNIDPRIPTIPGRSTPGFPGFRVGFRFVECEESVCLGRKAPTMHPGGV